MRFLGAGPGVIIADTTFNSLYEIQISNLLLSPEDVRDTFNSLYEIREIEDFRKTPEVYVDFQFSL